MGFDETVFAAVQLVPARTPAALKLVTLIATEIPTKAAGRLLPIINQQCPLPADLKHVKRVRKQAAADMLEVLLCKAPAGVSSSTGAAVLNMGSDAAVSFGKHTSAGYTCAATAAALEAGADAGAANTDPHPAQSRQLSLSTTAEQLDAATQQLLTAHSLLPVIVNAAAHPPDTREQWTEWSRIWPLAWRVPEGGPIITCTASLSQDEQVYFTQHMRRALTLTVQHSVRNAAVVVDPAAASGAAGVIAEAADASSSARPLDHAIMLAIQHAAKRDLRLWPHEQKPLVRLRSAADHASEALLLADATAVGGGSTTTRGPQCLRSDTGVVTGVAEFVEDVSVSACKRAKLQHVSSPPQHADLLEWDEAQAQHSDVGSMPSGTAPGLADISTAACTVTSGVTQASDQRPYLCTGFDVFVVQEPCTMCAMALVHSRAARVIFCEPDLEFGAMGGCYKLHAQRSLNHHYTVYRMPLAGSL